jgi:ATP-dependent protease ClpP protease subunit
MMRIGTDMRTPSPVRHLLEIFSSQRRIPFRWILAALLLFLAITTTAILGEYGFLFVSVSLLTVFSMWLVRCMWRESRERARSLPDTGEMVYGFAGSDLRAFCDDDGQVWIRAADVRALLGLVRSDAWMAQAYRDGYRRAHPGVDAWFMSPEAVRRHWSGSTRIDVNRFLAWMDRELVPLQQKRAARCRAESEATSASVGRLPAMPRKSLLGSSVALVIAHWHGQHRLRWYVVSWIALLFLYGIPDWSSGFVRDPVAHYQREAMGFIAVSLFFWAVYIAWGLGFWRAAQRRLAAGGSVLAGVVAGVIGVTTTFETLDRMARFDTQMSFMDVVRVALDRDGKATVSVSADGRRLLMIGSMGRGTTLAVRQQLKRHPGVTGIELLSPGGRVVEGFGLAELIRERGLDTYVRDFCHSACTVAFVAGQERRIGPSARFGLHRSGVAWHRNAQDVSDTDRHIADFYLQHGVHESMVDQMLTTPFADVYMARAPEAIESGLATDWWEADSRPARPAKI